MAHDYQEEFFSRVADYLRTIDDPIVVELGSKRGNWVKGLYRHCEHHRTFCIDTWDRNDLFSVFPEWYKELKGLAFNKVFPIRGRSQDWGKIWPEELNPDMVYVDGSHKTHGVIADWKVWWPRLKIDGLMVFHDANKKPVDDAIQTVMKGLDYTRHKWGPYGMESVSVWKNSVNL